MNQFYREVAIRSAMTLKCSSGHCGRYLDNNKQLLDEVEHDIMNYQNRGLCYLPQPSASADNTDTKF